MIPREKLPQISLDQLLPFIDYLREQGCSVEITKLPCASLRPVQSQINKEKVKSMLKDVSTMTAPLITSSDSKILDGNHRWIAQLVRDKESEIVCVVCQKPIKELIELGNAFEGSFNKGIHERKKLKRGSNGR